MVALYLYVLVCHILPLAFGLVSCSFRPHKLSFCFLSYGILQSTQCGCWLVCCSQISIRILFLPHLPSWVPLATTLTCRCNYLYLAVLFAQYQQHTHTHMGLYNTLVGTRPIYVFHFPVWLQFASCKEELLRLLASYIKNLGDKVLPYAVEIKVKANLEFGTKDLTFCVLSFLYFWVYGFPLSHTGCVHGSVLQRKVQQGEECNSATSMCCKSTLVILKWGAM